jgi:murein DD-endopeptidase MepM/ murein hydrolase activator NlpD
MSKRSFHESRPTPRALSLLCLVLLVVGGAAGVPPKPPPAGGYRPPTTAVVLDPFRMPLGPYGPGNRGIEYGTASGQPIRAIGAGVVAFSGPVAGREVVSIDHPDGLRSTYTGVGERLVQARDQVDRGTVVARASGPFHLGVRQGSQYLNPQSLFGGGRRARLVAVVQVFRWPFQPGVAGR